MILRPGFIYGTRSVGKVKLPLGVVGSPLEMVNVSFSCACSFPVNLFPVIHPSQLGVGEKIQHLMSLTAFNRKKKTLLNAQ